MRRAWIVAATVAGTFVLLSWILSRDTGLVFRSVTTASGATVHGWTGAWNVPATGLYDLALDGPGPSSWTIDGHLAHAVAAEETGYTRTVWLTSGFHAIEITHEPGPSSPPFRFAASPAGDPPAPLPQSRVKPRLPRNPTLRRIGDGLQTLLLWGLVAALIAAIRQTVPAIGGRWRARWMSGRPTWGRCAAWIALATVMAFGAILRLDAITARYGPVSTPAWLQAIQTRALMPPEALRPGSMTWQPAPLFPHADGIPTRYLSDPYTYLKRAQEMPSFYDAHDREPVYPFAVKIGLGLFDNQDLAVSLTSAVFSLTAIWLTYVLGALMWSRGVGVAAALGLAIDHDAVTLASGGWRDDSFVAAVALCGILMLKCWRLGREPRPMVLPGGRSVDRVYVAAVLVGVAGGLAILVRLFAVSFLLGGAVIFLLALRTTWRRRLTIVGLAVLVAAVVAGPYFLNCWRVFGDPLYSFNIHGNIYRVAEGQQVTNQGTVSYIIGKAAERPFDMIDTLLLGVTAYPFASKWRGLDPWWPGLARWAAVAGIVGLLLLVASAEGRLVLSIVLLSVAPFAFTWKVDPNWRFTAHAYPFLLIAAAVAVSTAAHALVAARHGNLARVLRVSSWRQALPIWAITAAIAVASSWFATRILPARMFAEILSDGGDADITAGPRGGSFFFAGWTPVLGTGNVRMRASLGEGVLSIPLPDRSDYRVTLRLDPFPRPLTGRTAPLPVLEAVLNDTTVASVPLVWNAERVGAYDLVLPGSVVRRGTNRLVLRLQPRAATEASDARVPGLTAGDAFAVWYLRVRPPQR